MNNFTIQSLALTTVIAMVCAASVKLPDKDREALLGHIRDDTDNMLKMKLKLEVPRIPGNKTRCGEEFFCFAEKSLKADHQKKILSNSSLVHHLHQYNKKLNITCHPAFDSICLVDDLLHHIRKCAMP